MQEEKELFKTEVKILIHLSNPERKTALNSKINDFKKKHSDSKKQNLLAPFWNSSRDTFPDLLS